MHVFHASSVLALNLVRVYPLFSVRDVFALFLTISTADPGKAAFPEGTEDRLTLGLENLGPDYEYVR